MRPYASRVRDGFHDRARRRADMPLLGGVRPRSAAPGPGALGDPPCALPPAVHPFLSSLHDHWAVLHPDRRNSPYRPDPLRCSAAQPAAQENGKLQAGAEGANRLQRIVMASDLPRRRRRTL